MSRRIRWNTRHTALSRGKGVGFCVPVAVGAVVVTVCLFVGLPAWAADDFNPMRDAQFTWWDSLMYFYYTLRNRYSDYALVVQVSYFMTVLSGVSIVGVLVALLVIYFRRRRKLRYRRKMLRKYGKTVLEVLRDPHELSAEEVDRRLQFHAGPRFKRWRYAEWVHGIMEIYSFVRDPGHELPSSLPPREARKLFASASEATREGRRGGAEGTPAPTPSPRGAVSPGSEAPIALDNPLADYRADGEGFNRSHALYHNLRSLMTGTGLQGYMEDTFREGVGADRLFLMQVAQQFHLPLPGSVLMRMYNSRNSALRQAARHYHVYASPNDPYFFLKETDGRSEYPFGDWLWIHHVLGMRRAAGKDVPSLVPMLEKVNQDAFRAFLILETGFWGSQKDMEYVMHFFTSGSEACRKAAFVAVAQWGYTEAEPRMMELAHLQAEALQRVILVALLTLASGEAAAFLERSYHSSGSMPTKRMALRCLFHYGPEGHRRFEALKTAATEVEAEMFSQIERANTPPRLLADGNVQ